jgi:predicted phosphodiesterase
LWRQKSGTAPERSRLATIRPVLTAIVSDLHLGIATGSDIARLPEVRERLVGALEGADRVLLLGDLLELRERPLAEVLEHSRPLFEALGEALEGRGVTLVPGNHDYQLAEPWLSRARVDGTPLALAAEWPVGADDGAAGRLAEWMPRSEVTLAYPGLWLREDVYATHGHYLDVLLTVPRLESIAASAMARLSGRGEGCRSSGDYEAVLAPLYSFFFSLTQGTQGPLRRGGTLSRTVWAAASDGAASRLSRLLLGRVTIPGAVAILNRVGIGPFHPDISGVELRRSGLRAMAGVVESLDIEAEHVIFGHTHRPGPLLEDDGTEWTTPRGVRLWNTGSWLHEPVFLRSGPVEGPYWPGTVMRLADDGPPVLDNALHGVTLETGV